MTDAGTETLDTAYFLVNQGPVAGNNRSFVDVPTYLHEMKLKRREAVDGSRSIDPWDQQLVTLVAEYLLHKSIFDTCFVWIGMVWPS